MSENTRPVPGCLRVVVTAVYADGSSIVTDIREPAKVVTETEVIYPEDYDPTVYLVDSMVDPGRLQLVFKINLGKYGAIQSVAPVPITGEEGGL